MEIEVESMETKRKGYLVTDPRLAKALSKYGLSFTKVGKLIGAKRSRTQLILYGQYPISRSDLDIIEQRVKEKIRNSQWMIFPLRKRALSARMELG